MEAQQFDMVRSKVFNFHSLRFMINVKLKTKGSQKINLCIFKLSSRSDSNLMLIRMYKVNVSIKNNSE